MLSERALTRFDRSQGPSWFAAHPALKTMALELLPDAIRDECRQSRAVAAYGFGYCSVRGTTLSEKST